MLVIDFSEPRWLINYYHTVGLASLILNSIGIYLLLWECTKLGHFRYYLLGFQVTCAVTDIHVNFLTQPIPITPFFSIYTIGILSEVFDVSPHICAVFGGFITIAQLEALVLCFAKKQQAISKVLKKHVIPNYIIYFCYFLCVICPITLSGYVHFLYMSQEEPVNYILKNYPELLQSFLSLPNFVFYIKGLKTGFLGISIFIGGVGLGSLFLLFIVDIFRSMKELKIKLSKHTYQKHHEAIQSLIVQFFSSILCFGAPSVFAIVAVMNIDNAQPITQLIIAWFTSHSSLNMICLFFFFPPFQRFFMKYAKRESKIVNVIPSSAVF